MPTVPVTRPVAIWLMRSSRSAGLSRSMNSRLLVIGSVCQMVDGTRAPRGVGPAPIAPAIPCVRSREPVRYSPNAVRPMGIGAMFLNASDP